MFEKTSRIVFIIVFLLMLVVPLVTTNLQNGKVSEDENRKLAEQAKLFNEDGTINKAFTKDFEKWINDNIGLRSMFVLNNARIQYYIFWVLANNSNYYLGPKKELNYATNEMIKDYQHLNLYTEDRLHEIAASMQYLSDYVNSKGAQFYYYQCWDKHSIYPEYFPKSVCQIGPYSKTDGIVNALIHYSNVNVISPKEDLIKNKEKNSTYSVWGNATHWNQRGAYIGYLKLMSIINSNAESEYKVLTEDDYLITVNDGGEWLFGGIHEVDYIESFVIKKAKARLTNDKLISYAEDVRHRFFTNESVDNRTRLLIIGDSYFNSFILDDIAESFYETIIIWGDYIVDFKKIFDSYNPDIVIIEEAERVDRTAGIIKAALKIKEEIETH